MATKIQKWGNSLAVRLPKEITEQLSFREGSDVEIFSRLDVLVVKRIRHKQPMLKELLLDIAPENLHKELDWGKPMGKELW